MIDPSNLITDIPINDNEYNVIPLGELPEFDVEDYDLFDEKSFKKFMSDLERMVRSSMEYQTLIQYLRENLEMNQCAFYENINNIESSKIRIELHHSPLTLYDICLIVFNKRVAYQESLDIELVAKEVMFLHYKLMVGLIPLSETVHQLVHNGYLFVPTDKVLGNYKEFVNLYMPFFPPEQLDILERIENLTLTTKLNTDILKKSHTYIDCLGEYKLPPLQDLINMINQDDSNNTRTAETKYDNNKYIIPAVIVDKKKR